MENIHLLPTDKPSRLCYLTKKGKEVFKDLRLFDKPMPNILDSENQHIYIVCDEEIKVGDWCFGMDGIFQYKGKVNLPDVELPKKIILTTDQDLIADGVQAIDDEFLEWFVKNPSCEYVKTELLNVSEVLWEEYFKKYGVYPKYPYYEKIIIPQEEPKQETLTYTEVAKKEERIFNSTITKQETLEEAFSKELKSKGLEFSSNLNPLDMFNLGAKWQAERMYSEEEVLDLLLTWRYTNHDLLSTKEWLEQFKKK